MGRDGATSPGRAFRSGTPGARRARSPRARSHPDCAGLRSGEGTGSAAERQRKESPVPAAGPLLFLEFLLSEPKSWLLRPLPSRGKPSAQGGPLSVLSHRPQQRPVPSPLSPRPSPFSLSPVPAGAAPPPRTTLSRGSRGTLGGRGAGGAPRFPVPLGSGPRLTARRSFPSGLAPPARAPRPARGAPTRDVTALMSLAAPRPDTPRPVRPPAPRGTHRLDAALPEAAVQTGAVHPRPGPAPGAGAGAGAAAAPRSSGARLSPGPARRLPPRRRPACRSQWDRRNVSSGRTGTGTAPPRPPPRGPARRARTRPAGRGGPVTGAGLRAGGERRPSARPRSASAC